MTLPMTCLMMTAPWDWPPPRRAGHDGGLRRRLATTATAARNQRPLSAHPFRLLGALGRGRLLHLPTVALRLRVAAAHGDDAQVRGRCGVDPWAAAHLRGRQGTAARAAFLKATTAHDVVGIDSGPLEAEGPTRLRSDQLRRPRPTGRLFVHGGGFGRPFPFVAAQALMDTAADGLRPLRHNWAPSGALFVL
jgi:hypothetical protein